jgi:uncharacterized protein YndB with AHSA1/START domain/uncharacterized protein YciI
MSDVPPIRREVTVDADLATSFEIFTSGIDRWWPIDLHSVDGAGGNVTFVDGQLIEQSAEGKISLWGTVTKWDPPTVVAFTWHPGTDEQRASRVEVTFTSLDSQTLVVLEHSGWEVFGDPAAARDEYDHGWPEVLARYEEVVAQSNGHTWVALLHSPGPHAPTDGSLFHDARFGLHLEFLGRMREAGYLIAAGPLSDKMGEGMTVLRLPGADQMDRAVQLATVEDESVACGFLSVEIRPWNVMIQAD